MASHTCTRRCGSKCDKCGICRQRVYVGNCETGGVILDDCEYCSPIKASCYVCGTSMYTYKTKDDDTIRVPQCQKCIRKISNIRDQNSNLVGQRHPITGKVVLVQSSQSHRKHPCSSSVVTWV